MIEQVLYCLMGWFDSPGAIEMVMLGTVPHHIDTLGVDPEWFSALITVTCKTITATIPKEATDELVVWDYLHDTMQRLFNSAEGYSYAALTAAAGSNRLESP